QPIRLCGRGVDTHTLRSAEETVPHENIRLPIRIVDNEGPSDGVERDVATVRRNRREGDRIVIRLRAGAGHAGDLRRARHHVVNQGVEDVEAILVSRYEVLGVAEEDDRPAVAGESGLDARDPVSGAGSLGGAAFGSDADTANRTRKGGNPLNPTVDRGV